MDFSQFQPPGVYISEIETATVPVVAIPPTVVALVGVPQGYQTNTEQVTMSTTVPQVLEQLGITVASIVVTRVDTGATVPTNNYTVSHPTGNPSTDQNYTTALEISATLPNGTVCFVSYQYVTPSYFLPQAFTNFDDVKAAYGEPLNNTAQVLGQTGYQPVVSPLSLAAQIFFLQGAANLVLVPCAVPTGGSPSALSASLRANLAAAYANILTDPDINIVVPVTYTILDADAEGVLLDLKTHVEGATTQGYNRMGFAGFDPAPSGSTNTPPNTQAAAVHDKRVVLTFGTGLGVQFYNGGANQYLTLGDGFLAVAGAGEMATQSVQQPLTSKYISGFASLIGQPVANSLKNTYSSAGVCVFQTDRYGRIQCRYGTTTDNTSVNTREISVIRAKDAMIDVVQQGLVDSGMIGSPTTADSTTDVASEVTSMLELCVSQGAILGYTGVTATQTGVDPSVITVTFSYQPAYPLNYIVVSFSIDTTTGTLTDNTANGNNNTNTDTSTS